MIADPRPGPRPRLPARLAPLALLVGLTTFGCDGDGNGDGGPAAAADASPDAAADCTPGTASCPCASDGTCGAGLACELGFCVPDDTEPSCDPGAVGCACAEGMCAAGLACADDVCVPAGCEAGTANCNCDDGRCDEPLACVDGVCGLADPPAQDALWVDGGDLRGCELLFAEGPVAVDRVQFSDGLMAEWLRRDGRMAMAFVGPGGAAVRNVGAIVLADERIATVDDLEVLDVRCFDAEGRAVAGAELHFE